MSSQELFAFLVILTVDLSPPPPPPHEAGVFVTHSDSFNPAGARWWANVVLMLFHCLRRWPNIETTLANRLVPAGHVRFLWEQPEACMALPQQTRHIYPMFGQFWANVVDGGPTLVKHLGRSVVFAGRMRITWQFHMHEAIIDCQNKI